MLNKLVLIENPFDPETWQETDANDVRQFLFEHFKGVWPDTARLYFEQVAQSNDITPIDAQGVEKIASLNGTFYCVVYPAGGTELFIAAIVGAIVAVVAMMKPAIPSQNLRNTQASSPNNELSARTNEARLNARIPDIYGTVRSTPDLIGVSYNVFENNQEVEFSMMCIGRGSYEVHDVRDGETLLQYVSGSSVEVFAPNVNIITGAPYFSIGSPIEDNPKKVTKSNSVNGQILRAPNANNYVGNGDVYFKYPDQIVLQTTNTDSDFTEVFNVGDNLTVSNSSFYGSISSNVRNVQPLTDNSFRFPMPSGGLPTVGAVGDILTMQSAFFTVRDSVTGNVVAAYDLSGVCTIEATSSSVVGSTTYAVVTLVNPSAINPQWNSVPNYALPDPTAIVIKVQGSEQAFDLNGTYQVLGVTKTIITLANPSAVNSNWNLLQDLPDDKTTLSSPNLVVDGPKWVGPYILDQVDQNETILNLYAANGIYKDDGRSQRKYAVRVEVEITQIDAAGNDIGAPYTYQQNLNGSAYNTDSVGLTMKLQPAFAGRRKVRVRRVSETDLEFEGSVVDEVKWRDLYSSAPIKTRNFGNVTVLRSKTYATSGALTLKERKLNMLVTRRIPLWLGDTSFTTELHPTNDAAEIISAVCLDKRLGNRSVSEIDFEGIYATRDEAIAYFGSEKCFEFCYTFDSDNLSFEETIFSIADSVFCQPYRRGNILKLMFRRENPDSVMLFNHRNKLPGSEVRTFSFGNASNNDGIEYLWVDPTDDAVVTARLPADGSAVNPEKIESVGVRNGLQAHIQINRAYNRLLYENTVVEFEALQEANTLILQERILVADNTRPKTIDGEIKEQDGLLIVASKPVEVESGVSYTAFLQLTDKTVEAVPVQSVNGADIILAHAPRLPLVTGAEMFVRTLFTLVANASSRQDAFLVTLKEPVDNFSTKITAANYSSKYWQNDKDFVNGLVDEDGNEL